MRRTVLPLLTVFALLLVAAGGAAASDAGTTITPSPEETPDDEQLPSNDSDEDGQMHIPEDQNHDGEIDERFVGDDEDADAGICLVGAESPCNDTPTNGTEVTHPTPADGIPEDGSEATHPTPMNDSTEIGSGTGQSSEGQLWIPEDQNRDGEIDDQFRGDDRSVVSAVLEMALPLFGSH